jgi:hypothetical protein
MKRVFLGWFVALIVPVQEIFFLVWLLYSWHSAKYFFPRRTLFPFIFSYCLASWAGSRDALPF